jgi:RNA polymerase sigma-B factor
MGKQVNSQHNNTLEEAMSCYIENNGSEGKDALLRAAEPLIRHYCALYSVGGFDEDLKQAAYEGLLKSIIRFDPYRGNKFTTYAVHCILGEIRHELRDRGFYKIPEWLKTLQGKIIQATEELYQKNKAVPNIREIAEKVNVSEEGIAEAMQAGCVSLDELDLSKVRHLRYESFKLPIEDVISVKMSLEKMEEMQKEVIQLIYYEGLTQKEVALRLGINQRKVSRLLDKGLNEMRAYLLA